VAALPNIKKWALPVMSRLSRSRLILGLVETRIRDALRVCLYDRIARGLHENTFMPRGGALIFRDAEGETTNSAASEPFDFMEFEMMRFDAFHDFTGKFEFGFVSEAYAWSNHESLVAIVVRCRARRPVPWL